MSAKVHFKEPRTAGVIAWTGGSAPLPWDEAPDAERRLALVLFREQMRDYKAYWDVEWVSPQAYAWQCFMLRARHDAHATLRDR